MYLTNNKIKEIGQGLEADISIHQIQANNGFVCPQARDMHANAEKLLHKAIFYLNSAFLENMRAREVDGTAMAESNFDLDAAMGLD